MRLSRHIRAFLTILAIVAVMAVVATVAGRSVEHRTLRSEQDQARHQLELHAQALQQRIDRYRTIPQVLALDRDLRDALSSPADMRKRDALNRKLEHANDAANSSTLTVIGRDGVAIAASNWRDKSTNVGRDYAFRPYLQEALAKGEGRFYGIGITTGEPGYFISRAIRADDGTALGAVVIKIELRALEHEWLRASDIVLVSDRHGVIFLSNNDAWRYHTLEPLGARDLAELQTTRQYADQSLQPLEMEALSQPEQGARLMRAIQPRLEHPVLWLSTPIGDDGWQLHLVHNTDAARIAARTAAIAAAGAWLALAFLALFVVQRHRLATYRRRSREELEAVLRQHAEELRTAQDGVLQAAKHADAGLSRSLEHLPQGVVVINRDLRLVAWNSRYAELFRFPPELLQVDRPIEDLFRHNARRGLLGDGPVEDAIQRRLAHLKSGSSHLRESEKEDGTVLEIRGNPLPDGGFVTSYADITSYKNTARELRSLADALEHRVDERTRALAEAKGEAEQANRYKTRFVASAVHDLLQPLNAARMFLSAVRSKPVDEESRALIGHAEDALSSQESILNSLLDISRLEAGSLPSAIHDFPLDPLLQTLVNEFGMMARDRGLELHHVATHAIVHSDRALLRRILQNLLSNAIRYTPRGKILLGCRRMGHAVRIEVHDQGPGIPEQLQREIFEEFRRLDDGVAHDRGTGLGLAIVERIGRMLEHPITLRSQLGHGSVFSVTVPLGNPSLADVPLHAVASEIAPDSSLHGCRVWCIDDDVHVCMATSALLRRWGCSVDTASNIEDALELARDGTSPDLLLLDSQLSNAVDGFELHALMRTYWEAAVPTVLVTAGRDEGLRQRALELGWAYLSKPVRPPALRALMSHMLLRGRA